MVQVVGGVSVDLLADAGIIVKEMERASRAVDQSARKMQSTTRGFDRTFSGLQASANRMASGLTTAFRTAGAAAAAFGVALSVREIVAMADAASLIRARLNLVTGSVEAAQSTFQALADIALQTRSNFGDTAGLFTQLANATSEFGASNELLLEVTDNVNKALIVSGANAASASAALFQLSQGLGAGALRGQELNSVLEQARPLAVAIAQELGVTVGQLRALGEQGKITTDVVLAAFVNMGQGADNVDDKFATMPVTIGQAMVNIRNSMLLVIDAFDAASGSSAGLGRIINEIAVDIAGATDEVAAFAATLAAVIGPLDDFWESIAPASLTSFSGFIKSTRKEIEGLAALAGIDISQAAAAEPVEPVKEGAVDKAAALQAELARIRSRAAEIAPVAASSTGALSSGLDEAAQHAQRLEERIADLQFETDFAGQSEEVREFAKILDDLGVQASVTASEASGLKDLLTIGTPTGVEEAERLLEAFRGLKEAEAGAEALRDARDASREFAEGLAELRTQTQVAGLSEEMQELASALQSLNVPFAVEGGSIVPIRDDDAQRVQQVRLELEALAAVQVPEMVVRGPVAEPLVDPEFTRIQQEEAAFSQQLQANMQQSQYEAYRFESAIGDAMGAMILEGADAGDTMQALARRIRDMVIEMLIIIPIAHALGAALQASLGGGAPIGGMLFGGFRQHGGPTRGGKAYVVGEKGPELWMDNRSGFVVSNDNLKRLQSGSGGNSVNIGAINQDNRGATSEMGQIARRAAWDMIPAIQQAVAMKAGHDPKYRKALRGRG